MGGANGSAIQQPIRPKKKRDSVTSQIKKKYKIEANILGAGAFGKVFLATSTTDEKFKVAIKVISKKKIGDDVEQLLEEISILKSLDHPNIIKYYETYENKKYIYIVMEYGPGGELFDVIARKAQKEGCFNEYEASEIISKLLKAINHGHSIDIAHRDIKPENILVTDSGDIKLIDFGLSKQVKNKKMKTIVGTPYYIAPEVLQGKYGLKCDIWSLGVILYILLSGYLPFTGGTVAEIFEKVSKGEYTFTQKEWKQVSPEAIDLVTSMLQVNTKKRLSAAQGLKHKWFTVATELDENTKVPLDSDLLKNLLKFRGSSKLRRAAMNIFVKTLKSNEFEKLREQFEALDENHTGQIDGANLSNALKKSNLNISDEQINAIIQEIDSTGNNMINYTEFLVATLNARKLLNEDRLMMLFKEFDTEDTGYITKKNLEEAFSKIDKPISQEDIHAILDSRADCIISYEEFGKMMLGNSDELVELK